MVDKVEKSVREKNYHRYKELLQLQQSQSEYMLTLERRILELEILNRIVNKNVKITGKFTSNNNEKQRIFEKLIVETCKVWGIEINQLFGKLRETHTVSARYTIMHILTTRNAYQPSEIVDLFKSKKYSINRTLVYNGNTKINNYFETVNDIFSKRVTDNYNIIVNNYML